MNQILYVPAMASIAQAVNKPVRLIQCIAAHNEEQFIGLTLQSIYDEVDKIIVIEGAVESRRTTSTSDGHSTDKTIEIIEDFKNNHDPKKKLIFVKINRFWKNLEEQKNTFLDLMSHNDIMILNDCDEFYLHSDINRIRIMFDREPHATEFIVSMLHFYKDFGHIAKPGAEWSPNPQRIMKYIRGSKFNSHPVLSDPVGGCTYFGGQYQGRRFVPKNPIFIYHYGFARTVMDQIMRQKQEYYTKELSIHGSANKKFDQKVEDWFANKEQVLEFDGQHPVIMNGHPMYNFRTEKSHLNIIGNWKDDTYYSKAINGQETGNIWLTMNKMAQPFMQHYHNSIDL